MAKSQHGRHNRFGARVALRRKDSATLFAHGHEVPFQYNRERPSGKGMLSIIGCIGAAMTEWCTAGNSRNRHIHVQIKKPDLGRNALSPFGYMNLDEATKLKLSGDLAKPPISAGIMRVVQTARDLQSTSSQLLRPFLSLSATTPGKSAYLISPQIQPLGSTLSKSDDKIQEATRT